MADTRSPAEIERDIERERAELSSTLESLTDKFSVDRVMRTGQDYLSEHGGELAGNFARTIKETPTAAVLTAIGLGWLIIGNQRQRVVEYRDRTYPGASYGGGSAGYDTSYRSGSQGTSGSSSSSYTGSSSDGDFEARVAAADARMRSQATGTTGIVDDDSHAYRTYDTERDTVSRDYGSGRSEDETSMLDRVSDQAQGLWEQTVASIRGGYQRATGSARAGYQSAYRNATELRNSFFEGTEKMDVAGRERVATARARAYQAQLRAQGMAQRGRQQAGDLFNEQPLVAGAIAMALGAVVGGLLPRTQREDEAFGAYRDQLFSDAETVFQDERVRAEAAARAALDEARSIGEEAKDSVLGKTPDGRETVREAETQARTAAQRVADAAREAHDNPEKTGTTSSA